jgi:hypothetical protein
MLTSITFNALVLYDVRFCSNQSLRRPCNKVQKLLCGNCIIFLIGLGLSFFFIYGLAIRQLPNSTETHWQQNWKINW